VGVVLYLLTRQWPAPAQVVLLVAITLIGIWAAGVAETALKREDPGPVVIDEVAGQLVTLLLTGVAWKGAIVGFFLFRVFDILKPFPARRLERLHGGLGIMADDIAAGVYGWGVMMALLWWWPGAW